MSCHVQVQERITKKAEKDFEDFAFIEAINNYESLMEKGHSNQAIYKQLSNANYMNANYRAAAD
ncbi:MAG: hypothetical protein WBG42_13060 [Cryomorphaceae bacterium]